MSEIIDINGKPASTDQGQNEVAAQFEHDINLLLEKYNGKVAPAYAAGVLFWCASNIHTAATTAMMLQNQAMMRNLRDAASKIPLQ